MARGALLVLVLAVAGCTTVRQPVVTPVVAETRWLLIKNLRFGEMLSEPQYVWVEADRVPITMTTLKHGKSAIIAPPEIVARYGPPPTERTLIQQTEIARPTPRRRCGSRDRTKIRQILVEFEPESAAPSPCLVDD